MSTILSASKVRWFNLFVAQFGIVAVVVSLGQAGPAAKLNELCDLDTHGRISATKTVIGRLSELEGRYFVFDGDATSTVLSRCRKGGLCGPVDPNLLQHHVGEQVAVEFCRHTAASVTISGIKVFQLTQEGISQNAIALRRRATLLRQLQLGFTWIWFWLLLQVAIEFKNSRAIVRLS